LEEKLGFICEVSQRGLDWSICRLQVTAASQHELRDMFTLGSRMTKDPFRVTPNGIELEKAKAWLSTSGEQRERFVMVCDNCLVRVFQIVGRGCQVDITAVRVNNSLVDTTITEMGPLHVDRVFFPEEVLVNARARQTFVIANDTPVDVKFSWKVHPLVEEGRTEI